MKKKETFWTFEFFSNKAKGTVDARQSIRLSHRMEYQGTSGVSRRRESIVNLHFASPHLILHFLTHCVAAPMYSSNHRLLLYRINCRQKHVKKRLFFFFFKVSIKKQIWK